MPRLWQRERIYVKYTRPHEPFLRQAEVLRYVALRLRDVSVALAWAFNVMYSLYCSVVMRTWCSAASLLRHLEEQKRCHSRRGVKEIVQQGHLMIEGVHLGMGNLRFDDLHSFIPFFARYVRRTNSIFFPFKLSFH